MLRRGHKFRLNGYNVYTTPHEDADRGVAILVKKGFDFDPISIYCDANGRYIIMKTVWLRMILICLT